MHTIYACTLEFDTDHGTDAWPLIADWWEGSFTSAVGRPTTISWDSAESTDGTVLDQARSSLRVSRHGASTLREIRGVVPDGYDSTLLWNTQVSYLKDAQGTVFEIVLAMSAAEFTVTPAMFDVGTPRIVRQLVGLGRARIGDAVLTNTPYPLGSANVPDLLNLLSSDLRRFPVIVVSPDPDTGKPLIDSWKLAEQLSGLAVVADLAPDSTYALPDALGKEFSCYHGAVRVYWPGFASDSDPRRHPLYLPWAIQERRTPEKFVRFLARQVYGIAAYRYVESERIRRFRLAAERDVAEATLARNREKLDYDGLFEAYIALDARSAALREEMEALRNENANLKANQNAFISFAGKGTQDEEEDEEPAGSATPTFKRVYDAVQEAMTKFPHLIFLDDAISSAADCPYLQPGRVYRVLEVLAGVAKRWAEEGDTFSWIQAFREKGVTLKEHVSDTALGKWKQDYEHVYQGTKHIFQDHVTLGKGMSAAKCMSIHFLRDEASRKVVVGHVGRHKTNTRTC